MKCEASKLSDVLTSYPNMRLMELTEHRAVIQGVYFLDAQMDGFEAIQENYNLQVIIPGDFPRSLPTVSETEERIPRIPEFHTYKDGSFCLGSEINLKSILFEFPTVLDFLEKILNPFLYAVTYKILFGIYPFGELDHGENGLTDDYQKMFKVESKASVLQVLLALGQRKRVANKLACPCGCNFRIGDCDYRFKLSDWRKLDRRRWFRSHRAYFTPVIKPTKLPSKQKGHRRNEKAS